MRSHGSDGRTRQAHTSGGRTHHAGRTDGAVVVGHAGDADVLVGIEGAANADTNAGNGCRLGRHTCIAVVNRDGAGQRDGRCSHHTRSDCRTLGLEKQVDVAAGCGSADRDGAHGDSRSIGAGRCIKNDIGRRATGVGRIDNRASLRDLVVRCERQVGAAGQIDSTDVHTQVGTSRRVIARHTDVGACACDGEYVHRGHGGGRGGRSVDRDAGLGGNCGAVDDVDCAAGGGCGGQADGTIRCRQGTRSRRAAVGNTGGTSRGDGDISRSSDHGGRGLHGIVAGRDTLDADPLAGINSTVNGDADAGYRTGCAHRARIGVVKQHRAWKCDGGGADEARVQGGASGLQDQVDVAAAAGGERQVASGDGRCISAAGRVVKDA